VKLELHHVDPGEVGRPDPSRVGDQVGDLGQSLLQGRIQQGLHADPQFAPRVGQVGSRLSRGDPEPTPAERQRRDAGAAEQVTVPTRCGAEPRCGYRGPRRPVQEETDRMNTRRYSSALRRFLLPGLSGDWQVAGDTLIRGRVGWTARCAAAIKLFLGLLCRGNG